MSKLDELLSKQMTRKQFIITLGMGVVSLFGFSSIMGLLTHNSSDDKGPPGYGQQNYGP